jgi:hypothetical protein
MTVIAQIRSWCIWKGLEEACPAAATIIADLLIALLVWLTYAGFHLLAAPLIPSDLCELTEQAHRYSTFAAFSVVSGLGVLRLAKALWP